MPASSYALQMIMYSVLAILAGFVVFEIHARNWADVFVAAQALVLSFIPIILEKRGIMRLPLSLKAGIVLFLFATLFLGEIQDFYNDVWWWDMVLHGFAGLGLTLISFILLIIFFREKDLRNAAFLTTLFAFSFGVGFSVLWELYEFAIDSISASENLMQPSNADTMIDIIAGVTGSLIVAVFGYAYLKFRYKGLIAEVIHEGGLGNQHLKNALNSKAAVK